MDDVPLLVEASSSNAGRGKRVAIQQRGERGTSAGPAGCSHCASLREPPSARGLVFGMFFEEIVLSGGHK